MTLYEGTMKKISPLRFSAHVCLIWEEFLNNTNNNNRKLDFLYSSSDCREVYLFFNWNSTAAKLPWRCFSFSGVFKK